MAELSWEVKELNKRLRLDALDREYHDACATRKGSRRCVCVLTCVRGEAAVRA
jgi:hypothetical protein